MRFRLRKSVPFDVEAAAVSYFPQPAGGKKMDVVAAVAPLEIVSRVTKRPSAPPGMQPRLRHHFVAGLPGPGDGEGPGGGGQAQRAAFSASWWWTKADLSSSWGARVGCRRTWPTWWRTCYSHLRLRGGPMGRSARTSCCWPGFGARTHRGGAGCVSKRNWGVEVGAVRSPLRAPGERQRRAARLPAVHWHRDNREMKDCTINLASQPFRRDRPMIWLPRAVVMSVMLTWRCWVSSSMLAMSDTAPQTCPIAVRRPLTHLESTWICGS